MTQHNGVEMLLRTTKSLRVVSNDKVLPGIEQEPSAADSNSTAKPCSARKFG